MSTVILIRGNSGSGKTSIANDLHDFLGSGTLLISQDYVRRTMLKVHDKPNNLAINLIETMIAYGIKNCEYTIVEGILAKNKYGDMLIESLSKADHVFSYYYDLPFEETVKRHQTKKETDFGEEKMKAWFSPGDLLNVIPETLLTKNLSREDTLQLIINDLSQSKSLLF